MGTPEVIATPYGTLAIAQAGLGDLGAVLAIDTSAYGWRVTQGYPVSAPPRPLRDLFSETIARGELYVARRDGVPAGKIALQWSDDLWRDLAGEACYVHGLAVHRIFAGQEVGRTLLRWADGQAAGRGKSLLRLDCDANNPELRAYYERAGFTHAGDVTLPYRTAARYEKVVAGLAWES
jgi:GNAT superfamily N-acetyltransferase